MAHLGIWSDNAPGHTTADLETKIGRKFNGYRFNKAFDAPIPSSGEPKAYDAGGQPFFCYRNAPSEDGSPLPWANWPKGTYDHYLDGIVQGVLADARFTPSTPYSFAFHHEPTAQHESYETPDQYKAAFRHISTYLRARIDARLRLVFDDTLAGITKGAYDPDLDSNNKRVGSFYDVLGLDVYIKPQSGHIKRTPAQVTAAASARSKAAGVPWSWFEFGVAEGASGEKAKFYSEMVPTLSGYGAPGDPGSCSGVFVSNIGLVVGKALFYPDTSSSSLAAFRTMANDSFFGG